jgi:hypothetical protein
MLTLTAPSKLDFVSVRKRTPWPGKGKQNNPEMTKTITLNDDIPCCYFDKLFCHYPELKLIIV